MPEDNRDPRDPPRRLSPVEQIRAMNQRRLAEAASERAHSGPTQHGEPAGGAPPQPVEAFRQRPPSAPRVELPPPPSPFGAEPVPTPPTPPSAPAAPVTPHSAPASARAPRAGVGDALQALREQTRGALGAPITTIAPPPKPSSTREQKRRDPWEAARVRQRARRIAAEASRAEGPPRVHPGYFVFLIAAIIAAVLLVDRDFGEVEAGASLDQLADDFRPRATTEPALPADEIPDSPVGAQLRWLIQQLNDRDSPANLPEIREHLDMGASLTAEVVDRELQQNARINAPYVVRGHIEAPTDHRLVMLFDTTGPHPQSITIAVAPTAPHGITALTITDLIPEDDTIAEPEGL